MRTLTNLQNIMFLFLSVLLSTSLQAEEIQKGEAKPFLESEIAWEDNLSREIQLYIKLYKTQIELLDVFKGAERNKISQSDYQSLENYYKDIKERFNQGVQEDDPIIKSMGLQELRDYLEFSEPPYFKLLLDKAKGFRSALSDLKNTIQNRSDELKKPLSEEVPKAHEGKSSFYKLNKFFKDL